MVTLDASSTPSLPCKASAGLHCACPTCPVLLTQTACIQVRLLGEHTDHETEEIEKTISRPKYFDPYEAVKFGIIDKVSCVLWV